MEYTKVDRGISNCSPREVTSSLNLHSSFKTEHVSDIIKLWNFNIAKYWYKKAIKSLCFVSDSKRKIKTNLYAKKKDAKSLLSSANKPVKLNHIFTYFNSLIEWHLFLQSKPPYRNVQFHLKGVIKWASTELNKKKPENNMSNKSESEL